MDLAKIEEKLLEIQERKAGLIEEIDIINGYDHVLKEIGWNIEKRAKRETLTTGVVNNHLNISIKELIIPPTCKPFIKKENNALISCQTGNRYGYIQYKYSNPIFEVAPPGEEIVVKHNRIYRYFFSADVSNEVNIDLVLLGFTKDKPTEVKVIHNGKKEWIQFGSAITSVKYLFRIQGYGSIENISLGITEKKMEPNYVQKLNLSVNSWLNPTASKVHLENAYGSLVISSARSKEMRPTYISYKAKNNSFSRVPKTSVFKINNSSYYEIIVNATRSGEGIAEPILVAYTNEKKDKIIPLKLNEVNKIVFNKSIVKCRVSFKINGHVDIKIHSFVIKERTLVKDKIPQWLDWKEPEMLGITGQKSLSAIKMAVIFDEFTAECFDKECHLIPFTPFNWEEILTANQPDVLMVESAWKGNGGSWTKKIQYTGRESINELKEVIKWCNAHNVPTVFWNKEDPVHYENFIETAKLFDFVFTSDANMIPTYKEVLGHDNVFCLMFAVQPSIHNPLSIGEREEGVSFAGSYYKKHKERSHDMVGIFNVAMNYNLVIYDRNYEKVQKGVLKNNTFPEPFSPYIRGSLKYYEIDQAYKGFKATINVNTVKHSPTMFARRVFEALASGTPVISNYSKGIHNIFNNIVYATDDPEELKRAFEEVFHDKNAYRKKVINGIREVLQHHTYSRRLEQMMKYMELPYKREYSKVTVFAMVDDVSELNTILSSFHAQEYIYKELCIISKELIDFHTIDPSVNVYNVKEFFETYHNVYEYTDADYIAIFSSSVVYPCSYLNDLMCATLYAPWEIIKMTFEKKELFFGHTDKIEPYYSIFKKELFKTMSIDKVFHILENHEFDLFKKRGARNLEIPYE